MAPIVALNSKLPQKEAIRRLHPEREQAFLHLRYVTCRASWPSLSLHPRAQIADAFRLYESFHVHAARQRTARREENFIIGIVGGK